MFTWEHEFSLRRRSLLTNYPLQSGAASHTILTLCGGTSYFWFFLYFDHTLYHVERMLDGRCSDVMEAQQWTLGRDVRMDSYTQYLQRVRRTLSGLTDFLWQGPITFHTFNRRGQKDRRTEEEHHEQVIQKLSQLRLNTPKKRSHLLLGILWLEY